MSGLLSTINPGLVLILAGVIAGLTPIQRVRQGLALVAPVLALVMLLAAPRETDLATMSLMGFDMVLYRVDSLSFIFALAFLIAAFINAVYALHNDNQLEDSMAMSYMGAAVAACFCGDFISLFVFWELTAVTSVFLIFLSGTRAAYKAGMRYSGRCSSISTRAISACASSSSAIRACCSSSWRSASRPVSPSCIPGWRTPIRRLR